MILFFFLYDYSPVVMANYIPNFAPLIHNPYLQTKNNLFGVQFCDVSFYQGGMGGMAGLVPINATEGKRVRQLQVGK